MIYTLTWALPRSNDGPKVDVSDPIKPRKLMHVGVYSCLQN